MTPEHSMQAEVDEAPACGECGSTNLRRDQDLLQPWFTDHHCDRCGWVGRYES